MKFSIMEARTTKRSFQMPLWSISAIIIDKKKLTLHQNASVLHCIPIAKNTWTEKTMKIPDRFSGLLWFYSENQLRLH